MAPQSHKDIGVFYVRRPGLVATAVYGARKITIYCSDRNCDRVISDFEKLLESAISSQDRVMITYICDWCGEEYTGEFPYIAWDWQVCHDCFNSILEDQWKIM